jgi:hypothetical protein
VRDVVALAGERLAADPRRRVGDAVAGVQACGMVRAASDAGVGHACLLGLLDGVPAAGRAALGGGNAVDERTSSGAGITLLPSGTERTRGDDAPRPARDTSTQSAGGPVLLLDEPALASWPGTVVLVTLDPELAVPMAQRSVRPAGGSVWRARWDLGRRGDR